MQLREFTGYLLPGEHMMWSGEPRQGIVLTVGDAFMIPFSLLWGGFAVFWESSVVMSNAPLFFDLWGIPFVVMGLYLILGRFFFDAWIRKRTAYVLTDRRVLIVRAAPFATTTSLQLRSLSNVQLKETSADIGTIQFGDPPYARWPMPLAGWPGAAAVPMFFQIEDARGVYARIQSLQEARSGT